jgi:hypothetical protein
MMEDEGFTIALKTSVSSRHERSGSLPVLAKKSTRDSKFDVVLGDEDGVVSRIVVELMPDLGGSDRLRHCEPVDLLCTKEDEVKHEWW